jgi:hypothetical protein
MDFGYKTSIRNAIGYRRSGCVLASTDNLNPNYSDRRLIPIGGGFVKIVMTAGPPLTIYLQDYYNVVNPELAPD